VACTTSSDCASGYACDTTSKTCTPVTAMCSSDGTESLPIKGSPKACAPYVCNPTTGDCYSACNASDQCEPGNSCTGGTCNPSNGTSGSGGCAVGGDGVALDGRSALVALGGWSLLCAVGAARRRREKREGASRR
jgi:hypothetical protein